MFGALLKGTRRSVLLRAVATIAAIALLDWRVIAEIPLGFLYLIPMVMVGSVVGRFSIVAVAVSYTHLDVYKRQDLLLDVFG